MITMMFKAMMNKPITQENLCSNASPPLQKLPGKIVYQEKKKVYKKNQFRGNPYFRLQIAHEEEKRILFVYQNIVSKRIFNDISHYNHTGKEYIFFCERMGKRLVLHDWKETK